MSGFVWLQRLADSLAAAAVIEGANPHVFTKAGRIQSFKNLHALRSFLEREDRALRIWVWTNFTIPNAPFGIRYINPI